MANDEHVALLKQGVAAWNAWRNQNSNIRPDLSEAYLPQADLREADFRGADLSGANLKLVNAKLGGAYLGEASLWEADLSGAVLEFAVLNEADLEFANLSGANLIQAKLVMARLTETNLTSTDLSGAYLYEARLIGAHLSGADLSGADLTLATLVRTDLTDADLTGCRVYGVSAWNLKGEPKQQNLLITPPNEPTVTVDNIEVAQFIYLMLNNQKVRDVIDTITSKVVLILGRFTQERKPVLEALREELRQRKYVPILFDFEKPRSRNTDETITLLARMARFVVAVISDSKSVLQELRAIVSDLPSVPVQPIILAMQEEPGMFDFYRNFQSFLKTHRYASQEQLIAELGEKVIPPRA
jgi:hypothetical protein